MPDRLRCSSGLEETAEHAFYYCKRVHPFCNHVREWTARFEPKQLVPRDVGYFIDSVLPLYLCEKLVVFLAILAVVKMVIWSTRKKLLYDNANFSHRDLILFFSISLETKLDAIENAWTAYSIRCGCMQQVWSYERGQRRRHLSLLFLHLAT